MEVWNKNLWETPSHIANSMAGLIKPHETDLLEPFAGTGQIIKALAQLSGKTIDAVEFGASRAAAIPTDGGVSVCRADYLSWVAPRQYDVIVTNPPFDLGIEGIEKSLTLLKTGGRMLFLLPCAFFHTKERAQHFKSLDAYIHRQYVIVGRIAYLKHGQPVSGRQCDDSIFDVRRSSDGHLFDDHSGGQEFVFQ